MQRKRYSAGFKREASTQAILVATSSYYLPQRLDARSFEGISSCFPSRSEHQDKGSTPC